MRPFLAFACALGACLALGAVGRDDHPVETIGIPFLPSISGSWKTEAETLNKQLGLVNAHVSRLNTDLAAIKGDVGLLQTKIGKLEADIGAMQVAVNASTNNVKGSQFLTGDVGWMTLILTFGLAFAAITGYQARRMYVLKNAGKILADSTSDDDAKGKAESASPAIKAAVHAAISEKNGGVP